MYEINTNVIYNASTLEILSFHNTVNEIRTCENF